MGFFRHKLRWAPQGSRIEQNEREEIVNSHYTVSRIAIIIEVMGWGERSDVHT